MVCLYTITMNSIPNCFYRVSIKALILNKERDKFLLAKEDDDSWSLPGGGLDFGTKPHQDLPREIQEEMGLVLTYMSAEPVYFLGGYHRTTSNTWIINVVYEVEVADLLFTPSEECREIAFVNKALIENLNVVPQVSELAEKFKPENHIR